MFTMSTSIQFVECKKVRRLAGDDLKFEVTMRLKADIPTEKLESVPGIGKGLTGIMRAQERDEEARGLNVPVTNRLGSADIELGDGLQIRAITKGNPSIWVTDTDARIGWNALIKVSGNELAELLAHLDGEWYEATVEQVQAELDLAEAA